VLIRPYESADAAGTLAVFLAAVTTTAAGDYAPEQIAAWADADRRDVASWHAALAAGTIVAAEDERIAGFSDVGASGYIDRLFVHPGFARRGIASALLEAVRGRAVAEGTARLWTNASITARPVFERHGFVVTADQWPVVNGVGMRNYRMVRDLD
jgi:putative acetyltransferase